MTIHYAVAGLIKTWRELRTPASSARSGKVAPLPSVTDDGKSLASRRPVSLYSRALNASKSGSSTLDSSVGSSRTLTGSPRTLAGSPQITVTGTESRRQSLLRNVVTAGGPPSPLATSFPHTSSGSDTDSNPHSTSGSVV